MQPRGVVLVCKRKRNDGLCSGTVKDSFNFLHGASGGDYVVEQENVSPGDFAC